jgi:excinuclease ABC subunit C
MTNAQSHFSDAVTKADLHMKGLEQIQERLGLPTLPRRIECYDISNFQGDENVASQVVFEEGLPNKAEYRRYKIKTVIGSNDFAAMKEVLERRFKHTEYEEPDLVVVDGGKGQLSMAVQALKEVGRPEQPVVGLAKARTQGKFSDAEVTATQERFFIPGRQNPITFQPGSEAFQILVGIRDEAHRFAITYHRKLRDNASLASVLDEINGLGEKRKKVLLKTFGSVDAIRQAEVSVIAELPGLNRVVAERVLLHLKDGEPDGKFEDKIEDKLEDQQS